jgi:NDP-sugar pyrophosphorylase family protein
VLRGDRVERYDKRNPTPDMRWIDYGLGGLEARALAAVDREEPDLAVLYERLAARGELLGYEAVRRFYEIGTPESLAETDAFLRRS